MRLRTSLAPWRTAFLLTLGLPAAACGGATATTPPDPSGPDGGVVAKHGSAFLCTGSTGLSYRDATGGFERCSEGFVHRTTASACGALPPRIGVQCSVDAGSGTGGCRSDADCTERSNGRCQTFAGIPGPDFCSCSYGCVADSDCSAGQICQCGEITNTCVTASCTSDAQCAGGMLCTNYVTQPGCGGTGFACQTAGDTCATDASCGAREQCGLDPSGSHTCQKATCTFGRPFLVEGAARLARHAARGDWRAENPGVRVAGVPADVRREVAARWTRVGLMEHASIAAFARFALQLLSVGAPSSLVEETHAAMADETRHAREAFAIAGAFGGTPVGPGRLAIEGAMEGDDDASILRTVIREGCIDETVAAIEAAEALAHVTDPALARTLAGIAADETRHAELAWKYVRWALSTGGAPARAILEGEIARATRDAETATGAAASDDADHLAFGLVGDARRRAIRRHALASVLVPCARALLAATDVEGDRPASISTS